MVSSKPTSFPFCPAEKTQLALQFNDSSQNVYSLLVDELNQADEAGASIEIFADPIADTSATPGVTVTPTLTEPGGTATILEPRNGGTVECPVVGPCSFVVQGVASPLLGQPDTRFNLHLGVKQINGEVFPQYPPISVDPETGPRETDAIHSRN